MPRPVGGDEKSFCRRQRNAIVYGMAIKKTSHAVYDTQSQQQEDNGDASSNLL